MNLLRGLADTIDLGLSAFVLLAVLLGLRTLLVLSLRGRRELQRRGTISQRPSFREDILEWLDAGLTAIVVILFLIRPFVAEVVSVTSPGMSPTLRGSLTPQIDGPNDRLIVNKYLHRWNSFRRGDVVLFDASHGLGEASGPLIKRVVGLPGDTVEIDKDGRLVVNGKAQDEPYVRPGQNAVFPKQVVPPERFFVLGDNRGESRDGLGRPVEAFLPVQSARGKAVAICWPPERIRLLR